MAASSLILKGGVPVIASGRRQLLAPNIFCNCSISKGERFRQLTRLHLHHLLPSPKFLPILPSRCVNSSIVFAMAESSSSQGPLASFPEKYRVKRTNRLASENSPYLLQHAHNPVDWYPWGEEAFALARNKNIPIFLSIGYSTCHWCHVMEVESFESEEVANLLNESFVSIKVDREERPDVDKVENYHQMVYMTFVQALYGSGGWPLSVFLSPNLKPLVGGTYFPPDDNYGRAGFKTVLRKVKEAWETKREKLIEGGDFAIEQLSNALSVSTNSKKLISEVDAINRCAAQLSQSYDSRYGGFGSAPKFPRPVEIQLMLYYSWKRNPLSDENEDSIDAMKMVTHSLASMANGGIHDHVGGGFHRYSVDELWHVPHFEKMLYDQAQLAKVYLDTFAATKNELYSNVARDILDYLMRQMVADHGGIYSAEDADSQEHENSASKKEGAFYVWTRDQIEDVLGDYAGLFIDHYQIKSPGNCDFSVLSDPHGEFKGKNVLVQRDDADSMPSISSLSVEEYLSTLGNCRKKLFNARSERPKPHLDDKVIVAWNGLTISSFAKASKILVHESQSKMHHFPVVGSEPKVYYQVAEKAASFIKENLYNEETRRLHHSFRNGPSKAPAFLDDYAFLISGLLDLFEVGGSVRWLEWAITLQETQDQLFLDKEGGAYYNTAGEDPSVLLRVKEDHDGAEPSGNSVSAINLIRLSTMVGKIKAKYYRGNAEHLLAVFEKRLRETAMAVPLMCCAAEMISAPSWSQVVLVGTHSSIDFDQMLAASHCVYHPNQTVIHVDPTNSDEIKFWEDVNSDITEMAKNNFFEGKVCALVCQNFTCDLPVFDKIGLEKMLQKH